MKRGTILWDRFMQQLVEIESVNKSKTWFMLAPVWSSDKVSGFSRCTMYGRKPSYLHLYCTPIWKDFPVSRKRIKKEPAFQFHDENAWGVEICINQAFLHTTEYLCDN